MMQSHLLIAVFLIVVSFSTSYAYNSIRRSDSRRNYNGNKIRRNKITSSFIPSFNVIRTQPFQLFNSNNNNNYNGDNSNNEVEFNDEEGLGPDSTDIPLLKKWRSLSLNTREDIKSTSLSFAIALLVRLFLIEPRYIPSLSMFPTFDIGDQLLVDKVSHLQRGYQRRDVVVFNPPETYVDLTGNTEALIKRVVAVEGDVVEVKDRTLYVNGVKQVEEYTNENPDYQLEPVKVPVGMLLVLGDNRNHSFDSHVWGFLPKNNVIGRAVLKYWPLNRLGFIEGST